MNTYTGLNEMEVTLPPGALHPRTRAPKKDTLPFGSKASREERRSKVRVNRLFVDVTRIIILVIRF